MHKIRFEIYRKVVREAPLRMSHTLRIRPHVYRAKPHATLHIVFAADIILDVLKHTIHSISIGSQRCTTITTVSFETVPAPEQKIHSALQPCSGSRDLGKPPSYSHLAVPSRTSASLVSFVHKRIFLPVSNLQREWLVQVRPQVLRRT